MSNPLQRAGSDSESPSGSLVRGGLGLLGGIALCTAALLAQAALLHALTNSKRSS